MNQRVLRAATVALPALAVLALLVGVFRPPGLDPAALPDSPALGSTLSALARIVLTAAMAITLVIGPGLYLRHRFGPVFLLGPAFVWVPGTLLLATTGGVSWLLASRVDPQVVTTVLLAPVLLALLIAACRVTPPACFVPGEAAVCGLLILLVLVGTAKATWSAGPEGELYGGQVSRTLEASDRPDSRISYHVVQLVAHGLHPTESRAVDYFAPYSFSDRGPLAGLAAASIVLGSGTDPPYDLPGQPWAPFDREGFAAYRITLEVLAATVVLSAFGLLSTLLSRRMAWAGSVLVATTPFVVHEVYFTWPKLAAASFGVAALAALLSGRAAAAGALLGLSYLAHPVGMFVALIVVGVWLGREWQRRSSDGDVQSPIAWSATRVRALVPLAGTMLVFGLAWRLANAGSFTQADNFGGYVFGANTDRPVELSQWLTSRLRSLGNTLVPFELPIWDRDESHIIAYTPGAGLVDLLYWNTLPFAVGIVYFPVFLLGLGRFARRNLATFAAGIVLPFAAFAIYWGSYVTGLVREGLQGWLVVTMLAAFVGHSVGRGSAHLGRIVQVVLSLRGIELLIMLTGSTLLARNVTLVDDGAFLVTDVAALLTMLGGVGILAALSWRAFAPSRIAAASTSPSPRHDEAPATTEHDLDPLPAFGEVVPLSSASARSP